MADKIVSQVRWYRKDLTYFNTTTVDHANTLASDVSDLFGYTAPGMKPVSPCNVMLRRNGKLVSYKDFQ